MGGSRCVNSQDRLIARPRGTFPRVAGLLERVPYLGREEAGLEVAGGACRMSAFEAEGSGSTVSKGHGEAGAVGGVASS